MTHHIPSVCAAAAISILAVLPADQVLADTLVASWNLKHLGWNNGKDLSAVADVASRFDLIALQEVMNLEALQDLERVIEADTGEPWSIMASDAIGRGSYRELYAFLWRDAEFIAADSGLVYIDRQDVFSREPFSARFQTNDGYEFILASTHLIYGDSVEVRKEEARALADYQAWLADSFSGIDVYLAGDFNLPPDNPAWSDLASTSTALIIEGATTLSSRDGRYANLYDNIWAPNGTKLPLSHVGIFRFPEALGVSHEAARDTISDHAPVWMMLDASGQWITFEGG